MNQISKKFFKYMLLGSIFVTMSCEVQEKYNENNKRRILVEDFSLRSIQGKTSSKLLEVANKIKSLNIESKNSKTVYNATFDFYMDDEHGKHVVVDNKNSYTFEITRTTGDQKVENIIFNEKADGTFDTFILKYDFTKEEYLSQNYALYKSRNKDLYEINFSNGTFSKGSDCIDIYVNPRFFKVPAPCTNCMIEDNCAGGGGGGGSSSNSGGNSSGNTGAGGWTGYGTSGWDSGGNGNNNSGYGNTGQQWGSSGGGISTTPVVPATPCQELASKDADEFFNSRLTDLTTRAASQNFESGFAIYQNASLGITFSPQMNGDLNNPETQGVVALDVGGLPTQSSLNAIGFMHCHVDGVNFKVFSFADIVALAEIVKVSTRPTEEFVLYVTTSSGTLALKVKNRIGLKQKLPMMVATSDYFEDTYEEKIKINDNYEKQKIGL